MKIHILFYCVAVLFSIALVPAFAEPPKELTVSAAISLKNSFDEIGKLYESRNVGAKVLFNFGASGDLMKQIEGGAPVDVFASAAQKDMDEAEKKGLVGVATRANIAVNSVVLVIPASSNVAVKSFEDLRAGNIKKIAIGNPKTVPAGRYAEEVFSYYRILDAVKDKFILTENVRQALDYVARDEVDAGIVYATDATTRAKEVKIAVTAPDQSHKPVIYPIAAVKGTKNEASAKAFIAFVLSAEGQKILGKYGFRKP